MGMDLTLLVSRQYHCNSTIWGVDAEILLHQDGSIPPTIELLPESHLQPLPRMTQILYKNEEISTDCLGNRLTYCLSQSFKQLSFHQELHPWNLAVFQFVQSLPENTAIVFLWS